MMNTSSQFNCSCFCGAVQFTVRSDPELMAYCHCDSCRKWSASPVNAFTLWKPEAIAIIKGEEHIKSFSKSDFSIRKWCEVCGGHLFIEHPPMGLIDIPAALISNFKFTPALHVNYQEAALHLHDGLVKMKDLPEEAGGSGEVIPE